MWHLIECLFQIQVNTVHQTVTFLHNVYHSWIKAYPIGNTRSSFPETKLSIHQHFTLLKMFHPAVLYKPFTYLGNNTGQVKVTGLEFNGSSLFPPLYINTMSPLFHSIGILSSANELMMTLSMLSANCWLHSYNPIRHFIRTWSFSHILFLHYFSYFINCHLNFTQTDLVSSHCSLTLDINWLEAVVHLFCIFVNLIIDLQLAYFSFVFQFFNLYISILCLSRSFFVPLWILTYSFILFAYHIYQTIRRLVI